MHGADQHVDLVALDQAVGVLRRVLGLGLVVELDELDLAPAELAALLREQHFDGEGDVLAELGERARVGEHQPDLQGLGLRDGPADRNGRGRGERCATLDDCRGAKDDACRYGGHASPPWVLLGGPYSRSIGPRIRRSAARTRRRRSNCRGQRAVSARKTDRALLDAVRVSKAASSTTQVLPCPSAPAIPSAAPRRSSIAPGATSPWRFRSASASRSRSSTRSIGWPRRTGASACASLPDLAGAPVLPHQPGAALR